MMCLIVLAERCSLNKVCAWRSASTHRGNPNGSRTARRYDSRVHEVNRSHTTGPQVLHSCDWRRKLRCTVCKI